MLVILRSHVLGEREEEKQTKQCDKMLITVESKWMDKAICSTFKLLYIFEIFRNQNLKGKKKISMENRSNIMEEPEPKFWFRDFLKFFMKIGVAFNKSKYWAVKTQLVVFKKCTSIWEIFYLSEAKFAWHFNQITKWFWCLCVYFQKYEKSAPYSRNLHTD